METPAQWPVGFSCNASPSQRGSPPPPRAPRTKPHHNSQSWEAAPPARPEQVSSEEQCVAEASFLLLPLKQKQPPVAKAKRAAARPPTPRPRASAPIRSRSTRYAAAAHPRLAQTARALPCHVLACTRLLALGPAFSGSSYIAGRLGLGIGLLLLRISETCVEGD